ncbi:MAG: hypothetical protein SFX73_01030 [Kofleriaceae bacterium]|nr:hypothetical protein [Kofleriaceae bacterium]
MIRAAALAALFATAACSSAGPATCDDLRGVWRTEGSGARWMILDQGRSLEGYPLFDDSAPVPGLETAPRVLDLVRDDGDLRGEIKRRFMRGADVCLAKVPARVTACTGTTLELVLADPVPPLSFAPCTWGTTGPSRRERWQRE